MRLRGDAGLTLVELLVSLAVFSIAITAFASMVVGGAKLNKSQQLAISAQSNARNCVSIMEQALRTAGWDPKNAGFSAIVLESPATAADNWIEVLADLDEDGATTGAREDMTFRLNGTTLEWRTSASGTFETLAPNITNDADGDGTPELMFTPDSTSYPTRITIKVTARSASRDPRTGQYIRATVSTDVVLRGRLS
jgi:prepilin-type N-terminal cleavage/methylation domain-containing protein